MKVLYVGYPKCGTKTMTSVLRTLGFTCFDNAEHFILLSNDWIECFKDGVNPDDLRRMYSGVDAAVGTPVFHYWEEFLEAFPNIKVSDMQPRDEVSWLQSIIKQRDRFTKDRKMQIMSMLSPTAQKYTRLSRTGCNALWGGDKNAWPWQMYSGMNFQLMLKQYKRHNAYLQMKAPENRLLVVDFKKGWGPICKFLGKPIPDEPFPHANKSGKLLQLLMAEHSLFRRMKTESIITLGIMFTVIAVLIYNFV